MGLKWPSSRRLSFCCAEKSELCDNLPGLMSMMRFFMGVSAIIGSAASPHSSKEFNFIKEACGMELRSK